MISLCYLTIRPGGFDLLADSFPNPYTDGYVLDGYELVVVDDYNKGFRGVRGKVQEFLLEKKIKLGWYGPSKPKAYPETLCGFANAVNTAVVHAKGDYLVFLCDFTTLPRNWLDQWTQLRKEYEKEYQRRFLLTGGGLVYGAPKPVAYDDIKTWPGQEEIWEKRWEICKWAWQPHPLETAYWGAPIEFFEEINGVDERTDHSMAWNISSLEFQAKELHYELLFPSELRCNMMDHRVWDSSHEKLNAGLGLWRMPGEVRSLLEIPVWQQPSPNPYSLKDLRKENKNG